MGTRGLSRGCVLRISSVSYMRLNGTVSRNNHTKRFAPCRCLCPTVGQAFSSVRLHIYVPSHIWLKYCCMWRQATNLTLAHCIRSAGQPQICPHFLWNRYKWRLTRFAIHLLNSNSILRLNIAYFAVAEGWLLLDIGWFVLFFQNCTKIDINIDSLPV